MAQLIKLKDYISRYELDIYRYPSQYIRLKRENWEKTHQSWEKSLLEGEVEQEIEKNPSILSRWNLFRKKNKEEETKETENNQAKFLPKTENELRHHFLEELYPFQLKWATSSISHVSFMNEKYNRDNLLKYFLKRFPDNYFLMYYPIFNIKKAPIDGEIILISPLQIEIICVPEVSPNTTIMVSDERTWTVERGNKQSKILSPIHALKRTEQLVKSILKKEDINLTIKKTVLAKNNSIIFAQEPYNTRIIGKREYEQWFKEKRQLDSPLKSNQLKAAGQLLNFCLTTSIKRPEWEEDMNDYTTVGED